MTDRMPDEIFAWPSDVTPTDETALAGSWGQTRFPDEAVRYARADAEAVTVRFARRIRLCRELAGRLKAEGRNEDAQSIVDLCRSAETSSGLNSSLSAAYRATLADARQASAWIDALLDAAELAEGDDPTRILPEIWPVISAAWQERNKGKMG